MIHILCALDYLNQKTAIMKAENAAHCGHCYIPNILNDRGHIANAQEYNYISLKFL